MAEYNIKREAELQTNVTGKNHVSMALKGSKVQFESLLQLQFYTSPLLTPLLLQTLYVIAIEYNKQCCYYLLLL